jgi:hypothetical protein
MYNSSQHYYKLAKMRQEEILKELEIYRQLASSQSKSPPKNNPRVAWALVGPVFTIVVPSIIV